jgi:hypothetical protein
MFTSAGRVVCGLPVIHAPAWKVKTKVMVSQACQGEEKLKFLVSFGFT